MGVYVNPGNQGFREMLRSDYVDKTGMIALINETLETTRKLTCVSRPRRFGKTFAAKMLCAYYDYTCDSRSLFDSLEITFSSLREQTLFTSCDSPNHRFLRTMIPHYGNALSKFHSSSS
jgi:hypothetical protein